MKNKKNILSWNNYINENQDNEERIFTDEEEQQRFTYEEKQQMVKDFYSNIENISNEVLDFLLDKKLDIPDVDNFLASLQAVILKNVDFHEDDD